MIRSVFALALLTFCFFSSVHAQVLVESGSLMAWTQDHVANHLPIENTEAFVVPSPEQLIQWRNIMDALLNEETDNAADSLNAHFSNYRIVQFTDTTFSDFTYFVIRENYPVALGWGTYILFPNYQRNMTVAVPHPLNDENTPFEGIDLFQYSGARLFVLAGTHRCSNAALSDCDGTTGVCNGGVQQAFRVSDMAHKNETPFQVAHEAMFELAPTSWFFNVHGHNDNDCADIFLSSGRADDVRPELTALRDSLVARGLDSKHTGDGTSCPLTGGTNTQGRLVNGSLDPCETANVSNTGRFFHIEQSPEIRREQAVYKILIEEINELVPRAFQTITLPTFPEVVLNEFLPFPRVSFGDANGNGSVNQNTDEFFELVNNSGFSVDLSGWSMADFRKVRHVFPFGSRLLKGQAIVVFSKDKPAGSFGGAVVQGSSTDSLSLANTNDTIYLLNAGGATVWRYSYANSDTSISRVRHPEITGDFTKHTLVANGGARFSPGTTLEGKPFLPNATIVNSAGWRMLASPTIGFSVSELKELTPIQGFGDGHAKNFYTGYNGTSWTAPTDLSGNLSNGNGFILYFYNNNLAGSAALPVTLAATGTNPVGDVNVSLHQNGDKFNFLGNPFDATLDLTHMQVNGGSLASAVGQIWNPQTGFYTTTTALDDKVAPWQGFFLENNSATSITFPESAKTTGGTFVNGQVLKAKSRGLVRVELLNAEKRILDAVYVVSDYEATVGVDRFEAVKLSSLGSLGGTIALGVSNRLLHQWSMPYEVTEEISAALYLEGNSSVHFLRTVVLKDGSPDWNLELVDKTTGIRQNLFQAEWPVQVERQNTKASGIQFQQGIKLAGVSASNYEIRSGKKITNSERVNTPLSVELLKPFPNPFNPTTTIPFTINRSMVVQIKVFSVNGQFSSVITRSTFPAGKHAISWSAAGLSSGVYFIQATFGDKVQTQKITLLK